MTAVTIATDIMHHSLGMAWKVGWGLVLGFAISGAIQAFISKARIAEHLGKVSFRSRMRDSRRQRRFAPMGGPVALE